MSDFYMLTELAKKLIVNPATLRKWARAKKIPFYKIGGKYRFNKKEITEWIKTKKGGYKKEKDKNEKSA